MTAQILQIRDFQNKKDIERMQNAQAIEQQALEIMNVALISESVPFGGQGIDGMFTDTACSEMNPEDCA